MLTVTRSGDGEGRVTTSPPGIDCGADCDEPYDYGTRVRMWADPENGSSFGGWSGDPDCHDGVADLHGDRDCVATFTVCSLPDEMVLENVTIDEAMEVEACNLIRVGPDCVVTATGSLLLTAGEAVILNSDVAVEAGGTLTVITGP